MQIFNHTLPTPEENLACDEALLDTCEEGDCDEVLHFWEPEQYFVVVGYGNKVATEVNVPFCQENRIPILRRCTAGGAVLQGPGVLNYSLILRSEREFCQTISKTNEYIMSCHEGVMSGLLKIKVERRG